MAEKAFDYPDKEISNMNLSHRTREIGVHPLSKAQEIDKSVEFSDFEHYIRLGDIPAESQVIFKNFLRTLFSKSKELWRPAGCTATKKLDPIAQELTRTDFPMIQVEPRRFGAGEHYWLVAYMQGVADELIIDPFGVPIPNSDYWNHRQSILPFFGLSEFAPNGAGDMFYERGLELGALGYTRFMD